MELEIHKVYNNDWNHPAVNRRHKTGITVRAQCNKEVPYE